MKLYCFCQNNSGGRFSGDYLNIYIEANNEDEAIEIAENKTNIYFDGCENGSDCSCCGDRWSRWTRDYEIIDIKKFIKETNKHEILWKFQAYQKYSPEKINTITKAKEIVKMLKNESYWNLKNLILLKNGHKIIFDVFSVEEIDINEGK